MKVGAEAAQQALALVTHPVRHVDVDLVAKRAAERGDRDAGIAAGGFCDPVAGPERAGAHRTAEDRKGHAVLDRAGEIIVFRLGVDHAFDAAIAQVDGQERCAADQV